MMLDVFKGDAFSFTELTTAINLIPFVQTKIGSMGLFTAQPISTLSAAIEMKGNVLSLVPTAPRGSVGAIKNEEKRTVRDFRTVHLPQRIVVQADEVQGIRAFGSQSEVDTAKALMARKQAIARRDLDLTHEWQRMGAIKGEVRDADGTSVIYNWYTEFGVTQQTLSLDLANPATKVRGKLTTLERMIEDELGGLSYSSVWVPCSPEFLDALVDHPWITETFKYTDGGRNREPVRRLTIGNFTFEEYRGTVAGNRFIAAGEAYAVPQGVPDMFITYFAPADYWDTVNTLGLPFYQAVAAESKKHIEWEVQSNPLHINTRPRAVIKLTA